MHHHREADKAAGRDGGMEFLDYNPELGGQDDPMMLVDLDEILPLQMIRAQIESMRSSNAKLADANLRLQPELSELQENIRELRENGLLEVADSERADAARQKLSNIAATRAATHPLSERALRTLR